MVSVKRLSQSAVDRQYLKMAFEERSLSDDPKGKVNPSSAVGAIIVGQTGILSQSANIFPPGLATGLVKLDGIIADEDRYFVIEHAERAAIFKALMLQKNLRGATIYCTRFPCADCARSIVWSGISRGVFSEGPSKASHWSQSQEAALRMMHEAGIVVQVIHND
jgi:dCMP deaminase